MRDNVHQACVVVYISFMASDSEFGQIEWARVQTARSHANASNTY